jgi:hypothetical protein
LRWYPPVSAIPAWACYFALTTIRTLHTIWVRPGVSTERVKYAVEDTGLRAKLNDQIFAMEKPNDRCKEEGNRAQLYS